jgi:hypothetical protein
LLAGSATPALKISNEKNLSFRKLLAVKFLRTPVFADLDKQMNEKPKLKAAVTRHLRDTPGYGKPYKEAFKDAFPQIRHLLRRLKPRPLAEIENITINQIREEMIKNKWLPPSLEMTTRGLDETRPVQPYTNEYFSTWNGYLTPNQTQIIIAADTIANICEAVNNVEEDRRELVPQSTAGFTSRHLLQIENEEISPSATEAPARKMKIQRVKKWRKKIRTGNADDGEESSEEEPNQAKKLLKKRRARVKEPGVEDLELEENAMNEDSTTAPIAVTRSIPWNDDNDLSSTEAKEEEPQREPAEETEPEKSPANEYVLVEEKLIVEEPPKGENTFLVVEEPLAGEKSQIDETTNAPTTESAPTKKPLKKRKKTPPVKSGPKIMRVKKYRRKNKPPLPKKRIKKRRKISDRTADGQGENPTTPLAIENDSPQDTFVTPKSEAEFSTTKSPSEPTLPLKSPEQQMPEQTKEVSAPLNEPTSETENDNVIPPDSAASPSPPFTPGAIDSENGPSQSSTLAGGDLKKPRQMKNKNITRAFITPTKSGETVKDEATNTPGVENDVVTGNNPDKITESNSIPSVLKSQPPNAALDNNREENPSAKESEANNPPKKRQRIKSQPVQSAEPAPQTSPTLHEELKNNGPIKDETASSPNIENLEGNSPDGALKRRRKAKDKPNTFEFGEQELPKSTQLQKVQDSSPDALTLEALPNVETVPKTENLPNSELKKDDAPKKRRKVNNSSTPIRTLEQLTTNERAEFQPTIALEVPINEPKNVATAKKRRQTKNTTAEPNAANDVANIKTENQEGNEPEIKDAAKKRRRVKDEIAEPADATPSINFENVEQQNEDQVSPKNENPEEILSEPNTTSDIAKNIIARKLPGSLSDTETFDTGKNLPFSQADTENLPDSELKNNDIPKRRRKVKDSSTPRTLADPKMHGDIWPTTALEIPLDTISNNEPGNVNNPKKRKDTIAEPVIDSQNAPDVPENRESSHPVAAAQS